MTATISAPVLVSAPAPIFDASYERGEIQLTIRAVLPVEPRQNARNLGDTKETFQTFTVLGLKVGENGRPVSRCLVTLRLYCGRSRSSSTVYSALWVHGEDHWTTGKGSAGGYGYCKRSQAAAGAIESAGIELYGTPYGNPHNATGEVDYSKPCDIGGVGESAIKAALLAIGQALGYSDLVCESF
jgi:hypothetical protein